MKSKFIVIEEKLDKTLSFRNRAPSLHINAACTSFNGDDDMALLNAAMADLVQDPDSFDPMTHIVIDLEDTKIRKYTSAYSSHFIPVGKMHDEGVFTDGRLVGSFKSSIDRKPILLRVNTEIFPSTELALFNQLLNSKKFPGNKFTNGCEQIDDLIFRPGADGWSLEELNTLRDYVQSKGGIDNVIQGLTSTIPTRKKLLTQ